MILTPKRELKTELIKVRQDPQFGILRSLVRRTIKYIEKLEQRISELEGQTSKSTESVN